MKTLLFILSINVSLCYTVLKLHLVNVTSVVLCDRSMALVLGKPTNTLLVHELQML